MANSENTPEFMAETAGDDSAVRAGLMERLGGVVILFAYVEQWLNEFLAHLLEGNSALMHTVTANVSSATVTNWCRTLLRVHHHPDEPPADIMELLDTIDGLRGERNALVHGLWRFGEPGIPGTAIVQTIKLDRSPVVNQQVVTLADLHELTLAIGEAKNALGELGKRLGFPRMPAFMTE
jgi:hypothetical protein